MSRMFSTAALCLAVLFALSGCGGADGHGGHELPHGHTDNVEITASPDILPSFLDDYSQTTRDLYIQAYAYGDILKHLNCYCGCMDYNDPHDSLYRCFIVRADGGEVAWTDHGANCGLCLMEVRDAAKLAQEGKSFEEIKAYIDATYGGAA